MKRLMHDEYVPFAPDTPGNVRINHDVPDCQGTSKSLSISRNEAGVVYGKCYRCGKVGRHAEGAARYQAFSRAVAEKQPERKRVSKVELPYDLAIKPELFPMDVRVRLGSYFITDEDIKRHGIGWSPKLQRLLFPVWRNHELVGWQARSWDASMPKYITRYKDESDLFQYIKYQGKGDGELVCTIVEDYFSGVRCSRYTNALVLLGSSMGEKALMYAARKNNSFIVYMDRDTRQVKFNAVGIRDTLTSLGKPCIVVCGDAGEELLDPKEQTEEALKELLDKGL